MTQLHIRIPHELPSDPAGAYVAVHSLANNVEARLAGSGIVADNLAARLLGVRADALYARVLFLFLGLPGAVLAALITGIVAFAAIYLYFRIVEPVEAADLRGWQTFSAVMGSLHVARHALWPSTTMRQKLFN